jgi:hypothetical protein
MYFVKIDQLRYPDMTTALQACYNINADWHNTFFLEAISFKGLLSQWAGAGAYRLNFVKFQSILIWSVAN